MLETCYQIPLMIVDIRKHNDMFKWNLQTPESYKYNSIT